MLEWKLNKNDNVLIYKEELKDSIPWLSLIWLDWMGVHLLTLFLNLEL